MCLDVYCPFFGALLLLRIKCLRLVLLLTLLFRLCLSIFSQPAAALGCRTRKAWVLSLECRVKPRQRLLLHDGLSWILLLCVPALPASFSFFPLRFAYPAPISPPFCINTSPTVDCAFHSVYFPNFPLCLFSFEDVTSYSADLCAHPIFPLNTCQSYLTFFLSA